MQVNSETLTRPYQNNAFQNDPILSTAYGNIAKIIQTQNSDQEKVRQIAAIFTESIQLSRSASDALALQCLDELEKENLLLLEANNKIDSGKQELKKQNEELRSKIEKLVQKADLIQRSHDEISVNFGKLEQEKQTTLQAQEQLKNDNAILTAKVQELINKKQVLQTQKIAIEEQNKDLIQEKDLLKTQNGEFEIRQSSVEQQIVVLNQENQQLKQQVEKLECLERLPSVANLISSLSRSVWNTFLELSEMSTKLRLHDLTAVMKNKQEEVKVKIKALSLRSWTNITIIASQTIEWIKGGISSVQQIKSGLKNLSKRVYTMLAKSANLTYLVGLGIMTVLMTRTSPLKSLALGGFVAIIHIKYNLIQPVMHSLRTLIE
ncbi:hypothetical protein PRO82_000354 [Candidatus Protochlamydia amoebophila]|uniref:hypothetical protein n=1 Tax=Candidatus Protochlamydia amoebophila TaxID=362787 RepID=UPI001BC962A3|nr:hypothetical protein [Candidatus Protochlamydia amoebophila]MBS4163065.1 hypothetical protein [Candidatus Protochlamydia amoebophila]